MAWYGVDGRMMVLCSTCGDAVVTQGACPTCGEVDPRGPAADPSDHLDEGLLDRVGVALAAQAALARKTAADRTDTASRLYDRALILRRRLRRQQTVLRSLYVQRDQLRRQVSDALGDLEKALEQEVPVSAPGTGPLVAIQLPRDRSCSAVARRLLEEHAREHLPAATAQDALLVASELATNALVHGAGAIEFHVDMVDERLRIEVCDQGRPKAIDVQTPRTERDTGRGLWLVEQISAAWGWQPPTGRVWADLAIAPGADR